MPIFYVYPNKPGMPSVSTKKTLEIPAPVEISGINLGDALNNEFKRRLIKNKESIVIENMNISVSNDNKGDPLYDLRSLDLKSYQDIRFCNCNLSNLCLKKQNISNTLFYDCNLDRTDFSYSEINNTTFSRTRFSLANFYGVNGKLVSFLFCYSMFADFRHSQWNSVTEEKRIRTKLIYNLMYDNKWRYTKTSGMKINGPKMFELRCQKIPFLFRIPFMLVIGKPWIDFLERKYT